MSEEHRAPIESPDDDAGGEDRARAGGRSGAGPRKREGRAIPSPDPAQARDDGLRPALFASGSTREILMRLIDRDPLELGPRCEEKLRSSALLLSPSRLLLRAAARVAYAARRYRGAPPWNAWLGRILDRSMLELLQEDLHEELNALPLEGIPDERFRFLSNITGMEPLLARSAAVRFNALPMHVRQAWFAVAVEGIGVDGLAAQRGQSVREIRALLERATRALGLQQVEGEEFLREDWKRIRGWRWEDPGWEGGCDG